MSQSSGPALRRGRPLWLAADAAKIQQRYPVLRNARVAEVAIVGGGMTGILTACAFAEAGIPVVLLESDRVGRGSTAASSALLLQEPDKGLVELGRRYGEGAAERIWRLSGCAVRDFVSILKRRRISCDLVERDAIYYATTQDAAARLRAELDRRLLAGFDGEWLTTRGLQAVAGISSPGAIRTRGNAQFDPYEACTGLAAVATSLGAQIFERSAVTRINQRRGRVRLYTSRGHVDAAGVVIATGYATPHFRPLAGRFRLYRTYVLATEPVSRPLRRHIGVADVMLWDTRRPYHYLRWGPSRRLLLGGGDRAIRPGQRRDLHFAAATQGLREYFQALFPALTDVRTERAWEGVFATTPDGLPYVGPHRRYPLHLFALGYGGNGMTLGFLASRMLLEQWQGIASPDHELFRFGR